MPTIQFEQTEAKHQKIAAALLRSLQLDPQQWLEVQTFELCAAHRVRVFGMPVPVPEALNAVAHWRCRLVEQDGSLRLLVGEYVWAAQVFDQSNPLSGVAALPPHIEILSLANLPNKDVGFLVKLPKLKCLDLQGHVILNPSSLVDISALSALTQLIYLNLSQCTLIKDISALSKLTRLTCLKMKFCSIRDFSALSGLTELRGLSLQDCSNFKDISVLSGLTQLSSLKLNSELTDISALSKLTQLRGLSLNSGLADISALSELTQLRGLSLSSGLADISVLSSLTQLMRLDLKGCRKLTDIGVLSKLTQLTWLNLDTQSEVRDFSALSELIQLTSLNLHCCLSLKEVSVLSRMTQLKSLNLHRCSKVRTLDPLASCSQLETLDVRDCLRLSSIEPVREISTLRKLEGFHPDQTAELLAHTAVLRGDRAYIDANAKRWVQQMEQMEGVLAFELERFATTLGEALSLLGESPYEAAFEGYLWSRPKFSARPWTAWFGGIRAVSTWERLRERVELRPLRGMTPGCVGGICATLGSEAADRAERAWALDWLERLEQAWGERGSELVPVAAELCVAHLRLGLHEALQRWLARLTDESDPTLLDPVHAALGRWHLQRGAPDLAQEHAAAIDSAEQRDPLLVALTKQYVESDPQRAGELLLSIRLPECAEELVRYLSQQVNFVREPLNIERLAAACGDTPEALSELIAHLPAEADATFLHELSACLREPQSKRLAQLRRQSLQAMLDAVPE